MNILNSKSFATALAAIALAVLPASLRADWTLAAGNKDGLNTTMTDGAGHYEYDEATSCNPRFAGDISLLGATSIGGAVFAGAGNVKSVTIGENLTSLTASGIPASTFSSYYYPRRLERSFRL